MFYGKKGITLISLVITIVIMLILAGVGINLIIGNNGLFSKTKTSKEQYSNSQAKEKLQIILGEYSMDCSDQGKDEEVKDFGTFLLESYKDKVFIRGVNDTTSENNISDLSSYDIIDKLTVVMSENPTYAMNVIKQDGGLIISGDSKVEEAPKEDTKVSSPTADINLNALSNDGGKVLTADVILKNPNGIVDAQNSKWSFNIIETEMGLDPSSYDFNFESANQKLYLVGNVSSYSYYYLHVLTVSESGEKTETISKQILINNIDLSTPEQLKQFALYVNKGHEYYDKTINLKNDIDLSTVCSETKGSWPVIGTFEHPFKGTFDGKGYTVSNIYFNDMAVVSQSGQPVIGLGLFGVIASDPGIVKNLTVDNVNITAKTGNTISTLSIGGIVGNIRGGVLNNCVVKGDVTLIAYNTGDTSTTSANLVGGCIGMASTSSTVVNCGAEMDSSLLFSQYSYCNKMGSFVGSIVSSKVNNCYVLNPNGNVSNNPARVTVQRIGSFTGGIEVSGAAINNCYYKGNSSAGFSAYTNAASTSSIFSNPTGDYMTTLNNWVNKNQTDGSNGYIYNTWENVDNKVVLKRDLQ